MHNLNDLKKLLFFFKSKNYYKVYFLKCSTLYPTKNKEVNLLSFKKFQKIFKEFKVGYSDHSDNELAILGAICLGAKIIEKHIAIEFNIANTQDWKVSYDLEKMRNLVEKIRNLEIILGVEKIIVTQREKKSKDWATKSIFLKKNIMRGSILKKESFCYMRPGTYIPVSQLKKIINKKVKKNLMIGNPLKLSDF